jgi:hypothetical protein
MANGELMARLHTRRQVRQQESLASIVGAGDVIRVMTSALTGGR